MVLRRPPAGGVFRRERFSGYSMQITLEYSLAADDFYEFQRAYSRHRRSLTPASQRGIRSPRFILFLGFACFAIALWFALSLFPAPPPAPVPPGAAPPTLHDSLKALLPFLLIFAILFVFLFWLRRSKAIYRRFAAQCLRLAEENTAQITDTHLVLQNPTCTATMTWTHFIRMIETKGTFLLFVLPRSALILPKRAFHSPAALDEFRQFAQARIGNQPIGFPVEPPKQAPATAERLDQRQI
jgi:hypothetical protein